MKGIILAGGSGSRLGIVSRATNKHANIVYKYPMIAYPIANLVSCGITEIQVVTNVSNSIQTMIMDGKEFGANITYAIQPSPAGIADALKYSREFVGDEKFVCLLGDNFYDPMPVGTITSWSVSGRRSKVFMKTAAHPENYGIMSFKYKDGTLIESYICNSAYAMDMDSHKSMTLEKFISETLPHRIVEKPTEFIGNLLVLGMYLYTPDVWRYIDRLTPSQRQEYEITDLNNMLLEHKELEAEYLSANFLDCGDCDSLLETSLYVRDNFQRFKNIMVENK
jgi:glucose-1-phosphate thymidylyltransferase